MFLGTIFRNLDFSIITNAVISVIPALICITFHELSHGFVAYKLGDPTAKSLGRLTLNPIKHIDIFGLLMMVVAGFGWAKPVPVDMRRFKNPKRGMAITALAGPVSNIVLAAFVLVVYGVVAALTENRTQGSLSWTVLQMIIRTAYLSVALAVFNMIPIPPLDGSKVLFSIVPDRAYMKLMRYERYGVILLFILIMAPRFLGPEANVFDLTIGKLTQSIFFFMAKIGDAVYRLLA